MAAETDVGELLHQRGWRTAFTVEERVRAWAALVGVIERGYGDDVHEYTNDLYCRALGRFHELPDSDLWWWRRHPRILTGDLGRSLRSAGAVGTDPDAA